MLPSALTVQLVVYNVPQIHDIGSTAGNLMKSDPTGILFLSFSELHNL